MFHYLIVTFFIVTGARSSRRDGTRQQVYVKFNIGKEDQSCGSSTQPCKHLTTAVNKSTDEIVITGTITVNSTVTLSRNVTISGNMKHHQPSTVKGEGMSNQTVFKLGPGIEVNIVGISFINIGVVESSENTKISINNCSVTGNVDKAFRFIDQHSKLTVNNTTFINIIGNVINEYQKKQKHAEITFIDSRFDNISCYGVRGGKLIDSLTIIRSSFDDVAYDHSSYCTSVEVLYSHSLISITDSNFTNRPRRKTYIALFITRVSSLTITGSNFNNIVSAFGIVSVWHATAVTLRHNTFISNMGLGGFCTVSVMDTKTAVLHHNTFTSNQPGFNGLVYVKNTAAAVLHHNTFDSNKERTVYVLSVTTFSLHHNIFNSNKVKYGMISLYVTATTVIHHNTLINNKAEESSILMVDASNAVLHHNTISDNKAGHSVVLFYGKRAKQKVSLHHDTFHHNKAKLGLVQVDGCEITSIDNCNFTNNLRIRSAVRIEPRDNLPIPTTTITNTIFHKNYAFYYAHDIYSLGHLTLRNVTVTCSRYSDISLLDRVNQIVNQIGNLSADLVRIKIQGSILKESNGVLVLSPQIKRFSNLSFSCPINSNVDLDLNYESVTKVYNSLSLKCVSCTKGTYSLESGTLELPELTTKYAKYIKEGRVECIECPVGGQCEKGGLVASPNFWGFRKLNHVSFVPCPIGYCCTSAEAPCTSYNTCNKGRKGVLCGRCKKGFRLNFFNDSCIKKSGKCNNGLFASYTTIYSLCITLLFAYVADITYVLKRIWIRLKRRLRCFDVVKGRWIHLKRHTTCFSNDERFNSEDQEIVSISNNSNTNKSLKQIPKLAVFHLFLFFYQLANLLHVKMEKRESKNESMEDIKSKIINFVYFRFVVHVHEHVCLTAEINFLSKKGIDFVFKLSTLANLLLFFIAWRLYSLLKKNTKIHSWLQRLIPTRLLFRSYEIRSYDIRSQISSWLERNVRIPLMGRRTRLQDMKLDRSFGDEENESFQEPGPDTNQLPEEGQVEVHTEDQTRIHDEDQEPTSSGYQKPENKQDIRNQGSKQSGNLPSQQQLEGQESEQMQHREYDGEPSREEASTLDSDQLSESDFDNEVSDEGKEDRLFNSSDTEDDGVRPIPFIVRLKLTLIKLLKTIYTPITEMCFQFVFCISLNGVKHLYLYGDSVCFTWWQNLILIVALPGLVLFPLTFGMSLHLVQTQKIASNKFLVAVGVPYYAIYLYCKKHVTGLPAPEFSVEDDIFSNEILRGYEEVFCKHNQLISWPVVQLYRNFIVASVKIFVIDPMYRSLMFLPILCFFLIHDRSAKPFLNKSINMLQTSSTVCLTMIVFCNIIFSFSFYMTKIDTIPHMNTVLVVLSYVESIVYFIFPLMLPISIAWRKYMVKAKEE